MAVVAPAFGNTLEGATSEEPREETYNDFRQDPRFATWRKHIRDLYQTCFTFETLWPARTIHPLPYVRLGSEGQVEHCLIAGSSTGGEEQEFVHFLDVAQPASAEPICSIFDPDSGELGGYGSAPGYVAMRVERRAFHNGSVVRARAMPSNPHIVATASTDGAVYVFDRDRIALSRPPNNPTRPLLPLPVPDFDESEEAAAKQQERAERLQKKAQYEERVSEAEEWDARTRGAGQHMLELRPAAATVAVAALTPPNETGAGHPRPSPSMPQAPPPVRGLAWTAVPGVVVAGAGTVVRAWNIAEVRRTDPTVLAPRASYDLGGDGAGDVNEVAASMLQPHLVGVARDDAPPVLIDLREAEVASKRWVDPGVGRSAVSLDFHPSVDHYVAIGDQRGDVLIFDTRAAHAPCSVLSGHRRESEVSCVQWSPHAPNAIASGGEDATVCVWNAVSETLLFRHCGHTDIIDDLAWAPQEALQGHITSVDASSVMFWKPRNMFWEP